MLCNIMNKSSGLALDAMGNGDLCQYRLHNDINQRFVIETVDDKTGDVIIHCGSRTSGFVLGIHTNSSNKGDGYSVGRVALLQPLCLEQQWKVVSSNTDGFVMILSAARPSLALDLRQCSHEDSAAVELYPCHGGENQLWRLTPTQSVLFPPMTPEEMQVEQLLQPKHSHSSRLVMLF